MTEYEASKILDEYITLPEVFQYYGYELRNGLCCCPFHNERTPSCKVNKFQFNCFGCGAKGNAVSFVEQLFNIDFKTAVQKINDDFSLGLLTSELTEKQKQKIRARKIQIYEAEQQLNELDNIKAEYMQAWKHYVTYKPTETDNAEEFFGSLDKRYLDALVTIQRLDDYARLYDFKIEEFEARQIFIDGRKPTQQDKIICSIVKLIIEEQKEQNRRNSIELHNDITK